MECGRDYAQKLLKEKIVFVDDALRAGEVMILDGRRFNVFEMALFKKRMEDDLAELQSKKEKAIPPLTKVKGILANKL